jgi:hypothetical protein
LVKNEVGSQIATGCYSCLAAKDGYGDGAFVNRRGACAPEDARGGALIRAVHNDCLEPSAGQLVNGGFGITAQLHADLQLTQNPSQYAYDLVVSAENKRY